MMQPPTVTPESFSAALTVSGQRRMNNGIIVLLMPLSWHFNAATACAVVTVFSAVCSLFTPATLKKLKYLLYQLLENEVNEMRLTKKKTMKCFLLNIEKKHPLRLTLMIKVSDV